MRVWKSPVFYFGILLVLAVAGLLMAPFIIDWNSYRADLEAYGRKLTGRAVSVEGSITARLFPWPSLTAEEIRIANPAGLETPEFARAGRLVVRMKLTGLLKGAIDVESIDIENPVIGFERLATGEGNWQFSPASDLMKSDLLSRVSLDSIKLSNGTLRFNDRRRGETIELQQFNASIASPGIAGPWRMRSVSLQGGRLLDIGVTTGTWVQGEPFRFGVRVAAADGSGLVFGFDGAQQGGAVDGELRIEPATTSEGKGDSERQLRPLVFTARVKGSFDEIDLAEIEIAPQDPSQGGALTTGSAKLKLGQYIAASAELSAAALDLDELAGAESRSLLREAGGLALAESLLGILPPEVSLAGSFKVTALKTGGETLDNVKLAIEAGQNAIRIREFSTGLPGRSQALFEGVYFPGATGAELAGSLALESSDLRQLSMWIWPAAQDNLAALWTGSRGRLKLQTDVSLTASRTRFSNAQYEIDGESGVAELSLTAAGRGAIDLRIDGKRVDFESFMPQGLPVLLGALKQGAGALAALALPHPDAPDLRLTLQAAQLQMNGVSASDVALDLASGANGLDLRTLEIGSVGGARLEATGLILDSGKGADGSIAVDVKAVDPRELLRLLGLVRGDVDPPWAGNLGPTTLNGDFSVKPGAAGSAMSFRLGGTAGDLDLAASGEISAAFDISGEATIKAPNSGRLMRLAGLEPATVDVEEGSFEAKLAGTPKDGFMVSAGLRAYGVHAGYTGSFDPWAEDFGLDGKLSVKSTSAAALIAATGVPVAALSGGVLVLDSSIKSENGGWSLPDLAGRLDDAAIKGALTMDGARKIEGHIETGGLALRDVLAAAFLNWNGAAPDLEAGFAAQLPFGLTGELWIRPSALSVHPQFVAREAEIGISAKGDEIRLALFGKDPEGRGAHIEIGSAGGGGSRKLSGKINIPVDLASQLLLAGGAPVASGLGLVELRFEGDGRSPGGVLAGLRGTGTYAFDDLRLLGLTPEAFTARLADARDGAGITAAFDALRGGAGLAFGETKGSITIADGEVSLLPVTRSDADADVQMKIVAELALGELDADIQLSLKARPGLPAMSVSYAGPPSALARSEDNAELATKLGVTLMQEGVDELERLQREQMRLAAEEEKQRILDEARLAAYYAQRDELILRKRELKVHAEMRVIEAERLRQKLEEERAANLDINKAELKQRAREIRVHRRLARAGAAAPAPTIVSKPRQTRRTAVAKPRAQQIGPVVLEQPDGAPVIILPEPGAAPSQ